MKNNRSPGDIEVIKIGKEIIMKIGKEIKK